ncbi:unnamed protein product [Prunus armeniaca]|uniref:PGG domain-containing protein n=1 Tax=Prunus armeniaca TaxID=36596 RepID=A0A6J5TZZ0_PRUAR|nr:unnamed protein product [Prunus armeniaca]
MKLARSQALELLDNMCEVIKHEDINELLTAADFRASKLGMFEFIDRVLQAKPNLVWTSMRRNLFQFAIEYSDNNCALHVAGMLSPLARLDNISGAALKMQRELQWFKEVENIVRPLLKESLNKEYKMPREMFSENHNQLVKEGERWMKETAFSCTVVGALIITIMFAATFIIPGGNNGETGFPIFLHKKLFMAFIVSDAISLFSSTTSVLMFLGILTSRYAVDDFLTSLPTKMIIGLSTVFISIATMMVAFSSALFIIIHEQSWIVIPMIFLASVPVTSFI